jgi:hypothetical protein
MIAPKHTAAIAARIEGARTHLIDVLAELGAIDKAAATIVADYYIAAKLVKLDAVHGRYAVKHGSLFDADCIRDIAKIQPRNARAGKVA